MRVLLVEDTVGLGGGGPDQIADDSPRCRLGANAGLCRGGSVRTTPDLILLDL